MFYQSQWFNDWVGCLPTERQKTKWECWIYWLQTITQQCFFYLSSTTLFYHFIIGWISYIVCRVKHDKFFGWTPFRKQSLDRTLNGVYFIFTVNFRCFFHFSSVLLLFWWCFGPFVATRVDEKRTNGWKKEKKNKNKRLILLMFDLFMYKMTGRRSYQIQMIAKYLSST